MGFGERLLLARTAKGFTGEYLGSQVGVSKQTISHWEAGRHAPDIEQIRGLCNALGVTPNWLLEVAESDLPAEALAEARIFAKLGPEDRKRWRTIRNAMFSTAA